MRRVLLLCLCLVLFCSCAAPTQPTQKQYTATFLELFDTVTTVVGRAESEEAFREKIQPLHDSLLYYHQLFDIYHDYDGINNLKTVNDRAGIEAVSVDMGILDLLEDAIRYHEATGGAFHPAMGSVLSLWHEAREDGLNDPENAYLPDETALIEAADHMDISDIVIDRENATVYLSDPAMKLDVGAIAKGWAVQKVCENAPTGLLLSVGGNVYATGPKDESGTPWAVGIKHPDNREEYLHILNITGGCVVTSGSYQRAYTVDGVSYHHIIDPTTLYPSKSYTSVTVVCADSGLADVLSTALFVLDREAGQTLLDRYNAHAVWVDTQGNKFYSPAFRDLIRN